MARFNSGLETPSTESIHPSVGSLNDPASRPVVGDVRHDRVTVILGWDMSFLAPRFVECAAPRHRCIFALWRCDGRWLPVKPSRWQGKRINNINNLSHLVGCAVAMHAAGPVTRSRPLAQPEALHRQTRLPEDGAWRSMLRTKRRSIPILPGVWSWRMRGAASPNTISSHPCSWFSMPQGSPNIACKHRRIHRTKPSPPAEGGRPSTAQECRPNAAQGLCAPPFSRYDLADTIPAHSSKFHASHETVFASCPHSQRRA